MTVTLEEAEKILAERSNGALEGISAGKGGRAWVEGEWQLCELEALCVKIRAHCEAEGTVPQGAAELIAYWKEHDL